MVCVAGICFGERCNFICRTGDVENVIAYLISRTSNQDGAIFTSLASLSTSAKFECTVSLEKSASE